MFRRNHKLACYFNCFLACSGPLLVLGQNDTSKAKPSGYVGLNVGIGLPFSDFNNTEGGLNEIGQYAKPGLAVNLSVAVPLKHSHIGIAGIISYGKNGFNMDSYMLNQKASYNTPRNPIYSSYYSEYNIMAGFFLTFPGNNANKGFSYDFRLVFGVLFYNTPEVIDSGTGDYSMTSSAPPGKWDIKPEHFQSFSSDIGVGVRYLFSKHLFMANTYDVYISSRNSSQNVHAISIPVQFTDSQTGQVSYQTGSLGINVFLFNITVGLGYQLGN